MKDSDNAPTVSVPIRLDWSMLITPHEPKQEGGKDILDKLVWTNHEEYYKGISKLWLSKILREGSDGQTKFLVAKRYVLASIAGNRLDSMLYRCYNVILSLIYPKSTTGQWMSPTELNGIFSGKTITAWERPLHKREKVGLYLPA